MNGRVRLKLNAFGHVIAMLVQLEDLIGLLLRCACRWYKMLCRFWKPVRRRRSRLLPRVWTVRVGAVRHVIHDDTRRHVIFRFEL